MKILLFIAVLLCVSAQASAQAQYGRHGGIDLPDDKVTPGVIATTERKAIVSVAWGKDARHVTQKMKVAACVAYGVPGKCPGKGWEIDHRVPRCAGGADDERNLWPQRAPEFHWKDRLETRVCKEIKQGKISVADAQAIFLGDWVDGFVKEYGKEPGQ
jgi:hypothetical protein